jgi:hypothetical protein
MMIYKFFVALMRLYPRQFRAAYNQKIRTVFAENIAVGPGIKAVTIFLRDLFDLPGSIISIYVAQ